MPNITSQLPLSLYVHIPWCIRKCPYCDFNSHAIKEEVSEQTYIAAMIDDLEHDLDKVDDRPIQSIFIGGGTPSLFSPASIEDLLTAISNRLVLSDSIEITLEANPGTVEYLRFAGFRNVGINRLSIGVQSFQNNKLTVLGRIHDGEQAVNAVNAAHRAGFDNINIDLMYGLPDQTVKDALFDIQKAFSLAPTHLSWYQLTIEPNTLFYKHRPTLPDEAILSQIEQEGKQLINTASYQQYEISAYSQAGQQCQHNLNYWLFGDYLGIGAGAHSKLTNQGTITRYQKMRQPKDYLNKNKPYIAQENVISDNEISFEFMLNALRLYRDIPFSLFAKRTGLSVDVLNEILKKAADKNFLTYNQNLLTVTDFGKQYLDELTALFLPG